MHTLLPPPHPYHRIVFKPSCCNAHCVQGLFRSHITAPEVQQLFIDLTTNNLLAELPQSSSVLRSSVLRALIAGGAWMQHLSVAGSVEHEQALFVLQRAAADDPDLLLHALIQTSSLGRFCDTLLSYFQDTLQPAAPARQAWMQSVKACNTMMGALQAMVAVGTRPVSVFAQDALAEDLAALAAVLGPLFHAAMEVTHLYVGATLSASPNQQADAPENQASVGSAVLGLIRCIVSTISSQCEAVAMAVGAAGTLDLLLDVMVARPMHNQLALHVCKVFQTIISSGSQQLLSYVLSELKLLHRLASLPAIVTYRGRQMRPGFLGPVAALVRRSYYAT